jgi:hypothetical protein
LTPKLTSVSARTPPKRSDTPRTSKACFTRSLPRSVFRQTCFRQACFGKARLRLDPKANFGVWRSEYA